MGFTLIELLIVIAIIGVLAGIAIPQYANYRIRGFNASSHADVRNMITAQEAYFVDRQTYTSATADLSAYGYSRSAGVNPVINSANSFTYNMKASHGSGDVTWKIAGPMGSITR